MVARYSDSQMFVQTAIRSTSTSSTNDIPQSGKVFEAWLIDYSYKGSGYMLSMGKLLNSGILHFNEVIE